MSATALEPGDKVSYRETAFSKWRDATVKRIDTSLLLPLILEDEEYGEVSVRYSQVL
jgi:hypothetical protein